MRKIVLFMKRVFDVPRGKNAPAYCRQTLVRLCLECTPKGYPPPRRRQAVFRPSASSPRRTLALPAQALAGLGIAAAASQSEVVTSSAGTISSEGRPASGVKGEAGGAGLNSGAEAAAVAGDPRARARRI